MSTLNWFFTDKPVYQEYPPSEVSEARWGQHALYTGKQQMYSDLVGYDAEYVTSLRRFNKVQLIFSIYWFRCYDAKSAQENDLWLIRTLSDYKSVDKALAEECLGVAYNHLQFLSPEFTFLSLVSNTIPVETKANLAHGKIRI